MDVFMNLVKSKDNTFDWEASSHWKPSSTCWWIRPNIWVLEVDPASNLLIIRCHCFSFLKASTTYSVCVCLSRSGDVYSAEQSSCHRTRKWIFICNEFQSGRNRKHGRLSREKQVRIRQRPCRCSRLENWTLFTVFQLFSDWSDILFPVCDFYSIIKVAQISSPRFPASIFVRIWK